MIRHDLSHWPLVITVASGRSTLDDMLAFTAEWNHWLDECDAFATLRIFTDAAALEHPEGSAQNAKKWLQEKGDAIRAQVMGMAMVVPPAEYERVRKMNVEKLFGVPAATFQDLPSALAWLQTTVFEPRDRTLDAAAATAAVEALAG